MQLTNDEIFEGYAKQWIHCTTNTRLPYEYDWTCI